MVQGYSSTERKVRNANKKLMFCYWQKKINKITRDVNVKK